jgi:hypothetical protein
VKMAHSTSRHDDQAVHLESKKHPLMGRKWMSWLFPIAGLLSLVWFILRVVPKPSRAAYPCQRVAAPLAGTFVLWITGVLASIFAFRKGRILMSQSRRRLAAACLLVAVAVGAWTYISVSERLVLADDPEPNAPIGVAKGVNPGRVVWALDLNATDWSGPGQGHWWEDAHTNQAAVNAMMSEAVRRLAARR